MKLIKGYFLKFLTVMTLFTCLTEHVSAKSESYIIDADSTVNMQEIQITAIKQGSNLERQAVSATSLSKSDINLFGVKAIKDIVTQAPNFFIPDYGSRMTSAIYIRGLGSRMENTAAAMNVDNVSISDKSLFDMQMPDIERIEVIRGPQSQLYGRNSMGGVINIYTTSALLYQGARVQGEYSSKNSFRIGASAYAKYTEHFGASVAAEFTRQGAFFENAYLGRGIDSERNTYCRIKGEYSKNGFTLSNILSFSILSGGGYPYRYEGTIHGDEKFPELVSLISYNEESTYDRKGIIYGCTIQKKWAKSTLSGIVSYQYLDDKMHMDNDFLPYDYFIMEQTRKQHDICADAVFSSTRNKKYEWMVGANLFFRHRGMNAPVTFGTTGIEELILDNINLYSGYDGVYKWGKKDASGEDSLPLANNFKTNTMGAALYHTSTLHLGPVDLSLALRIDGESASMKYRNMVDSYYTAFPSNKEKQPTEVHLLIDENDVLKKSFIQVLPRFSVSVNLDEKSHNMLYAIISKGYKPGGFNTQMFSEVLERKVKNEMGLTTPLDVEQIISYRPETNWNYEIGGHFQTDDQKLKASMAFFYINCTDQQLTVFPKGQTTGRMTTNAGASRSVGCEATVELNPWKGFGVNLNYGYTNAKFTKFISGENDWKGKHVPYAPKNTFSGIISYTHAFNNNVLNNITLSLRYSGAGRIFWNESNTESQSFYSLVDMTLRFGLKNMSVDIWTRNLLGTKYDVFYFESMGNRFLQGGRPRTFGIRINFNFLEK